MADEPLRYNQEVYQEVLERLVTPEDDWLDAGCGWHVLSVHTGHPAADLEVERELVARAHMAVGCDLDPQAARHRSLRLVVFADLAALPFRARAFDLVTCNMVIEHLDRPQGVFAEFARVLRPAGRALVHTPNQWSHFALSHWLPHPAKLWILRRLGDDRESRDVFPTVYRANSRRRLERLMAQAGFVLETCRMLPGHQAIPARWWLWPLATLERAWLRLLTTRWGRPWRVSILASFRRSG